MGGFPTEKMGSELEDLGINDGRHPPWLRRRSVSREIRAIPYLGRVRAGGLHRREAASRSGGGVRGESEARSVHHRETSVDLWQLEGRRGFESGVLEYI
jgi:hypothetical protein